MAGRALRDLLPRQLEIIYEINRRFLDGVSAPLSPATTAGCERVSLIEERPARKVRMAHLAVVGTHSTNGVAAIHSDLLRDAPCSRTSPSCFPSGSTTRPTASRRGAGCCWPTPASPALITEAIGDGWVTDLAQLRGSSPLADDAAFRAEVPRGQARGQGAVRRLAQGRRPGQAVDPDTIFDSQIKRIHEYKRQLLNVLHVVVLYNRLRDDPQLDVPPRTFFFAGKAAPAYHLAKLIIKLINNVAAAIDADPAVRGRLRVLFLPEYNVSLAERLIPASDVSEQISTAGYEASGTSNMKFMMNGALTVGTRDGATIEMAEAAGEENFFLFGLTAEQVAGSRGWYDPHWHYEHEPETRAALDLIFSGHFNRASRASSRRSSTPC